MPFTLRYTVLVLLEPGVYKWRRELEEMFIIYSKTILAFDNTIVAMVHVISHSCMFMLASLLNVVYR